MNIKMKHKILKRTGAALCALGLTLTALSSAYAKGEPSFWAESEVNSAIEKGYVPEDLQDLYTTDITRLQFARLAVSFLADIKGTTVEKMTANTADAPFSDTNDKSVAEAYALGILNGRGNGIFSPYDTITREEAAKVLVLTYKAYIGREIPPPNLMLTYNDTEEISGWAADYVRIVTDFGIMKGDQNNCFLPFSEYTIEQSIITFERIYKMIDDDESQQPSFDNTNPKIENMLYVKDGRLVSGSDENEVILNGVNLGSWLMMEMWMCPIEAKDEQFSYSDAIGVLESRFGRKKAEELITLYEDSFITDDDFAKIEALGFNCVRIPFWYRNFMNSSGNWFTVRHDDNDGFKRLDKIIEQCAAHGLYVILDMHGCPGGQSMNQSTGVAGKNELYNNEKNLSIMENLWVAIAERYKDNPVVAAYDIMNEPMNNGGYTGARAWQAGSGDAIRLTNNVYDRMIKAIRKTGDTHVITVEGIWSIYNLPDPETMGWDNMMYQLHLYDVTKSNIDGRLKEMTELAREKYKTAILVGEYNNKEGQRYASGQYDEIGLNRVKWTYKAVNAWYDGWGLYNKNINRVDIKTADESDIRAAFGEEMLTDNGFMLDSREYNKIMK